MTLKIDCWHIFDQILVYRTRAIITRSYFETTLDYKPLIYGPKIEEVPCLAHKLFVILTALQYGVKNVQATAYNGVSMVV